MKKIPTIFKRDPENRKLVTREINPLCKWVFDGEGEAYQKLDGTACMINDKRLFKRRAVRKGRLVPLGFVEVDYDPNTETVFGWVPVYMHDAVNKYHIEAFNDLCGNFADGTYELVGPAINGNPEKAVSHCLIPHNFIKFPNVPRDYDGLKCFLESNADMEGLVFHHEDGRMAKIKHRDFDFQSTNTTGK